ncbi:MAG: O-antigen ligase family protein [bacterium]|nr:O-antigen ligase family protein [bacterium]
MEEKKIKLLSLLVRPGRVLDLSVACVISLVVFARPVFSGIVFPRSNYIFLVMWFLVLILVLVKNITEKEPFLIDGICFLLILFFIVSVLSSAFSAVPWRGRNLLINQITWIAVYLSVFNYFKKRETYDFILYVLSASVILVSLYGLYQYFYGLQETREWIVKTGLSEHLSSSLLGRLSRNRVFSLFVYPNALAGFLLMTFPVVLSVFIKTVREKSFRKYSNIVIFSSVCSLLFAVYMHKPMLFFPALAGIILSPLTSAVTLYLTFSKGGLLAFSVTVFLYLVFSFFRFGNKLRAKAFSSALALVIIAVLLSSALLFQKYKGDSLSAPLPSAKVRVDYWKAGWGMLKDNPFLGVGSGAFGAFYPKYKLAGAQETQMAHNDYVQVAAETGLIGFGLYVAALALILFNMSKKCLYSDSSGSDTYLMFGIFMGITGILIDSLWEFVLYIPGISTTMVLLTAVFMSRNRDMFPKTGLNTVKNKTGIFISTAVILAAFVFSYTYSKSIVDSSDLLEQANKAFQEGRETSALDFISRAIKADPRNPQLMEYRGSLYEHMGYYRRAMEDFREASRLEPTTGYYHFKIATAINGLYSNSGLELPVSRIEYELLQAISCYPTKAFYYLQLGLFYDKIKNYGQALSNLEKAKMLEPELQGLDELIFKTREKAKFRR